MVEMTREQNVALQQVMIKLIATQGALTALEAALEAAEVERIEVPRQTYPFELSVTEQAEAIQIWIDELRIAINEATIVKAVPKAEAEETDG